MKLINFIKDYMAAIVAVVAVVSLFFPETFTWIDSSAINYLLGVIMLLMGMTLKFDDFKIVFTKPKYIALGSASQFIIMPSLAWILTKVFNLPPELAIGVILVGCCPGGTASNVITYLSHGDVALSVGITTVSTILAPILTPFLCWLLAGTYVDVDVLGMLFSITKIVILPIIAGFVLQKYLPKLTEKVNVFLPAFSALVISFVVGIVIGINSSLLMTSGVTILLVVILHNILGYLVGFMVGWMIGLDKKKIIALSVEVGMQNSGLACGLAQQHFKALLGATVPGALFSVWHNVSGAILCKIFNTISWRNISKEEQRGELE